MRACGSRGSSHEAADAADFPAAGGKAVGGGNFWRAAPARWRLDATVRPHRHARTVMNASPCRTHSNASGSRHPCQSAIR